MAEQEHGSVALWKFQMQNYCILQPKMVLLM